MKKFSYLGGILEGLIFFFIVLVILQTYGEELAVYMGYSVDFRRLLLVAGFCFDMIFSIEFIARLFVSGGRGKTGRYLVREGGIIDFFSSIPLLIFSSGPLLYMTYFAGETGLILSLGSMSFLKIVKTMRVVRTFRFVRTLKILGKTKTQYLMTPKYVASALIITISISVATLIGFTYFENGQLIQSSSVETKKILSSYIDRGGSENFDNLLANSSAVLFIEKDNEVIYRKFEQNHIENYFFNDDYYTEKIGGYDIYFNNKDAKRAHSLINMTLFSLIVLTIIGITTIYRRFFNKHISGVTGVMLRGFRTTGYSTPVRIVEKKKEFEIYELAEQYNKKWLPIKRRIIELKQQKE
jgi:hypothetical protein